MCDFFSVVSDGKGNVKHFTPEYIANEMAAGNKNNYERTCKESWKFWGE